MIMKTKLQTNNLVGASQKELDKEDQFLASLTTLAYEVPKKTSPAKKNRKSKFWFKLSTTEEYVNAQKELMNPRALEHIDHEVEDRLTEYKTEMPDALKEKIKKVREFFLTEIAPITLAAGGGALQAKEVAQRLLDVEVDSALFTRFDNMVNRAATLKLSQFVASLFDLPLDTAPSLLGSQPAAHSDPQMQSILNTLKAMQGGSDKKELAKLQQDISRIEKAVNHEKR